MVFRGHITENLDKLCDGERSEEEFSGKVWDFMRVGCKMNQLTRMVQILGDAPLSTSAAEHMHCVSRFGQQSSLR